jgi:bacillithiol system protein YtxJ
MFIYRCKEAHHRTFMNWNPLNTPEQLTEIDQASYRQPILIFKHSTRCGISSTALSRLERKWRAEDDLRLKPYYLDLLLHRDLSNEVASRYRVVHESPQVLVIKNGACAYSANHLGITYADLLDAAE